MFGLIKTLIVVAVLFAAIFVGLAYLPDDASASLGKKAAGVYVKGCRGGRALLDSFKSSLDEKKDAPGAPGAPEAPEPSPGDAAGG